MRPHHCQCFSTTTSTTTTTSSSLCLPRHGHNNCHIMNVVTTAATSPTIIPPLRHSTPKYCLVQPRNQPNGQFAAPTRVEEGGFQERGEVGLDAGTYSPPPEQPDSHPPPHTPKHAPCTSIDVCVTVARLQGEGVRVRTRRYWWYRGFRMNPHQYGYGVCGYGYGFGFADPWVTHMKP